MYFLLLAYLCVSFFTANGSTDNLSYGKERRIALRVARNWSPGPFDENVQDVVGYNFKTEFFVQTGSDVCLERINLFSPGLYKPIETRPAPKFTESFSMLPERQLTGWLPGDFFILDPEFAGSSQKGFRKKLSWGQKKDAFALIYSLNRLYDAGVTRFTLHGQCFGASRCTHVLYYLSKNEQSKDIEIFFSKAQIDRIRKEKLLAAIESICFQTPLKEASDALVTRVYSKIEMPFFASKLLWALAAQSYLIRTAFYGNSSSNRNQLLLGVGIFGLPLAVRLSNYYFGLDKKIIRNGILPYYCTYDSSEPDESTMLKRMEYMKNDYPNKSFFMTTAKNDRTVGDWGVAQFFDAFPVTNNRKFLVPSPEFGHCKVTNQQVFAKNAFLKWFGGSYYQFPEIALKQGQETLNFAQKGQSVNIQEYIEYMESHDNGLCH